jgi:hypothetical protein
MARFYWIVTGGVRLALASIFAGCAATSVWGQIPISPSIEQGSSAGAIFASAPAGLSAWNQDPVVSVAEPPIEDTWLTRLQASEEKIAQLEEKLALASGKTSDAAGDAKAKEEKPNEDKAKDDKAKDDKAKDDKAKDEKKKKLWYDKLTLRGYAQVRISDVMHMEDGSFQPQLPADASIANNQNFLIRRARLIVSGDVHEHLGVYLQPEFAANIQGAADSNQYVQIRDWYSDLYIDTTKVHRLRIGQSKIPFGWENLQSSSNRIPLDRNDAMNTASRNERDIGVFYYWTPEGAQDFFKYVIDEGLKGSGNYGVFGFGLYNGQGGSFIEQNDTLHAVARLTIPGCFANGQRYELGMQGYRGNYGVLTSPIAPQGIGAAVLPTSPPGGIIDEKLGWSAIYYPQPFGFQTEWTVGRGPALNDAQNEIVERSVQGGYVQMMYQTKGDYGTLFPFVRYNYYQGGFKWERNAPWSHNDEWEFGLEWQFIPAAELTTQFTFTDRTNTSARSQANTLSYGQFEGSFVRFQFQFNY